MTGSNGFTGRHLIAELEANGFQSQELSSQFASGVYILSETSIREFFLRHRPDYIVHLAAKSSPTEADSELVMRTNFLATKHLIDSAVAELPELNKFVFASSSLVYGASEIPSIETSDCNPMGVYAQSKELAEKYCLSKADHINI